MMLRFLPKRSLFAAVSLTAVIFVLYYAWNPPTSKLQRSRLAKIDVEVVDNVLKAPLKSSNPTNDDLVRVENSSSHNFLDLPPDVSETEAVCRPLPLKVASIETSEIYPKLNFNAKWMERREFWNDKMERRYRHRRKDIWPKLPLKVIIMPHSHNDPGWLKTYEGYFNQATKHILDNAVSKLTKYKNMTFVWTEMAFLSMWWDNAHEVQREGLKKLVDEGRFEVLTGGWVMTDEANVHLFAMVDQLIEGHQWLLSHLGIRPKSSWSVDPFGHGGTFPYILKSSGVDGMVIMRIHYAWKEYFAVEQTGDFLWQQRWDESGKGTILCHNFPYDIYSVKGSCGPHAQTCVQYNFAVAPGSGYSEYAAHMVPVNPSNLKERAETILEQYGRTGSLFPHNVVLVPLGDDFLYTHEQEWDQQYGNYKMIIDYINAHSDEYHAQIKFGTLSDYFKEVNERKSSFETLSGDFFVYSDIFTDGIPAYWSGYFTTRPYMKQLSRELESNLRAAEILFTLTYHGARQMGDATAVTHFSNSYFDLVQARRHLALFQHHDAITGTSKSFVMHDYGLKLFEGLIKTRGMQRTAIQYLLERKDARETRFDTRYLSSDYERHDFGSQAKPLTLDLKSGDQFIIVFNSLASVKHEVISFFVERNNANKICIRDPDRKLLQYQTNPTWSVSDYFRLDTHLVEIVFLTKLQPLSIGKYKVSFCSETESAKVKREPTQVFCRRCASTNAKVENEMIVESIPEGSVVIENIAFTLVFDEDTKLLSTVTHKATGKVENVQVTFGAYPTMPFRSGAYLFKTDSQRSENLPVFDAETLRELVIVSGSVFSELSLVHEGPKTSSFVHTVRLYHGPKGSPLTSGIYIENNVDFGDPENFRDIDFFMRIKSGVKNGGARGPPTFYSDQNGFQMQKRVKASNVTIEGNYFPITTMAFIEDEKSRISLLVDHAQGAASWQQGWLEVMVDRRSSYDDSRGMGEGVLDSRSTSHKYFLLFEAQKQSEQFEAAAGKQSSSTTLPSAVAHHLSRYLNYPTIQYIGNFQDHDKFLESKRSFLPKPYPCDIHLFNLRTLPLLSNPTIPSAEALLILHSQTPDCTLAGAKPIPGCSGSDVGKQLFDTKKFLNFGSELKAKHFIKTGLTGNDVESESEDSLDKVFEIGPMTLESVRVQF